MIFWAATVAYVGMVVHLGISLYGAGSGRFAMFGAPAGLVLFAVYLTDRRVPQPHRLAAAGLGVGLEGLRVQWQQAQHAQVSYTNMSIYFGTSFEDVSVAVGFPFGFGLALGLVATVGLWTRVVHQRVPDSEEVTFVGRLMIAQIVMLYSMSLVGMASANPATFDVQLYTFERALGVDIPATLGQAFTRWPLLQGLASLAYGTLSAAALGASFLQRRQRPRPPVDILAACGIATVAALIYIVVPACGPEQVFGTRFPHDVPDDFAPFMQHLDPALWRNAIPSMHATWALLIWSQLCFDQRLWAVRLLATAFTLLVLIATQGSGAHYFVDIVVAVPLALAVQAAASDGLSRRTAARWQAMTLGAVLLAGWLVTLCLAPQLFGRYSSWGAVILTLVTCGMFFRRLTREYVLESAP